MLELSIQVTGVEPTLMRLSRLAERVGDLSSAFESIHADFLEVERTQFDAEGAVSPWAQLTDDYVAWKSKRTTSTKILQFDRALERSLTSGSDANHIVDIGQSEARFGTNLITESGYGLGRLHQEGFTAKYPYGNKNIPSKKVPSRKPIDLSEETLQRWVKIIQGFVMESKDMFPEHFA